MKRKRLLITLLQSIIVILVVCGFYIVNKKQVEPTVVWAFNKNIPVNTEIKNEDLIEKIIPKKAITNDFVTNKSEVVGKYLNTQVFTGEYAIKQKFVDKNKTNPLDSIDLSKYRRVSLPINYVEGLGGAIKAGDKVDLVYVGDGKKKSKDAESEFTYAKIFLQDVIVETVTTEDGEKYVSKTENKDQFDEGKNLNTGSNGGALSTVVLAVTGEQSEEILTRLKTGTVRVVGRFGDSKNYNTQGFVYGNSEKVITSTTNPEFKK